MVAYRVPATSRPDGSAARGDQTAGAVLLDPRVPKGASAAVGLEPGHPSSAGRHRQLPVEIVHDVPGPHHQHRGRSATTAHATHGPPLLIAPEGTRSHTNRLKPFKKGAFHIALQTRVPIVPVVIRNATELWPRGSNFVRPGTVDVEVLPPVSTKNWKESTLQQHVNDVRKMFLKSLGQEELR